MKPFKYELGILDNVISQMPENQTEYLLVF